MNSCTLPLPLYQFELGPALYCQEKILFLCHLRFSDWGAGNETNKRQIKRRKDTQFLLIFICMGVHGTEVILKEAVRLGGLYTFLTKERGLGFK